MEQYYDRILPLVRGKVYKSVGLGELEDVTQDVLLKIWQGWGSFRGGSLEAWVDRITYNHIINHKTRQKSVEAFSMNCGWEDGEEEENHAGLSDFDSPDMEAEKTETPLTPSEEQMVELFGLGFTYSQIALITNRTEGSVQATISRAKQRWKSTN